MFVGHGLLAFAIVGLFCRRFGVPAERALVLATVAALFGTLPDVDLLYGPVGLLEGISGLGDAVDAFWATGNVTHRGPTHSLVIGAIAASGFALLAGRARRTVFSGVVVLAAMVGAVSLTSGVLDGAVILVFAILGAGIVGIAARHSVTVWAVLATALLGLLAHPFGDLLTGTPADFLYPFDIVLVAERIVVHGDPTIHLLAAFTMELAVIWFALVVYFRLTDRSLQAAIDPKAGLGIGYGAVALVLPGPTVDAPSTFVVTVLSIGLVGALPSRHSLRPAFVRIVPTGLAAITVGVGAYALVYLLT